MIFTKCRLLSAIHSPVRSMSTATVLSQSTGLSDFRSGALVVSTISNLLLQKEDGDFYVAAEILGIEGSGRWYYIFCITAGESNSSGVGVTNWYDNDIQDIS
nr:uncharacterized protein LOC109173497 [Ipomoea batatas]